MKIATTNNDFTSLSPNQTKRGKQQHDFSIALQGARSRQSASGSHHLSIEQLAELSYGKAAHVEGMMIVVDPQKLRQELDQVTDTLSERLKSLAYSLGLGDFDIIFSRADGRIKVQGEGEPYRKFEDALNSDSELNGLLNSLERYRQGLHDAAEADNFARFAASQPTGAAATYRPLPPLGILTCQFVAHLGQAIVSEK